MQEALRREMNAELENAERNRQAGNEGRARVCARRAAGIAARDFLTRHEVRARSSAYEALLALAEFPGLAPDLQTVAAHLTTHLTGNFTLPIDVDLIVEARKLIGGLD
jgi:hypothetical protein